MIENDTKIPKIFYDFVMVDYRRPEIIYHLSRLMKISEVKCIVIRHYRDKHYAEEVRNSDYINAIHKSFEIIKNGHKLIIVTTNDQEVAELMHNNGLLVVKDDQEALKQIEVNNVMDKINNMSF